MLDGLVSCYWLDYIFPKKCIIRFLIGNCILTRATIHLPYVSFVKCCISVMRNDIGSWYRIESLRTKLHARGIPHPNSIIESVRKRNVALKISCIQCNTFESKTHVRVCPAVRILLNEPVRPRQNIHPETSHAT